MMKTSTPFLLLGLALPIVSVAKQPNVIVIFTDDQGYEDLGCYGSPLIKTPNIDKMASNGVKFTDFYVSASVSSASRAGLMTGKLNTRNGSPNVFWPNQVGMPLSNVTIAQALKEQGYQTACFGKWHLGDRPGSMPMDRGFDKYMGIPYSNDMWISIAQDFAPNILFREGKTKEEAIKDKDFTSKNTVGTIVKSPLRCQAPLIEGNKIIEYPVEQSTLTERYFTAAKEFIADAGKDPFFLYITPAMPHWPLFPNEKFKGKSARGAYGDVVEEIDHHVGLLLKYLKDKKLDKNTLVIFTSDNGPSMRHKEEGGSAKPLRDGKFSQYDGGTRVPCVMQWTGVIPKGVVSKSIVRSIDLFPTFVHMAGDKKQWDVDGVNIIEHLKDPENEKKYANDIYHYVKNGKMVGIRKGDWKYLDQTGKNPQLYNLKDDISEKKNLINDNPTKVAELKNLMTK